MIWGGQCSKRKIFICLFIIAQVLAFLYYYGPIYRDVFTPKYAAVKSATLENGHTNQDVKLENNTVESKTSKGGHTNQDVKLENTTVESKTLKNGHTKQDVELKDTVVESKTLKNGHTNQDFDLKNSAVEITTSKGGHTNQDVKPGNIAVERTTLKDRHTNRDAKLEYTAVDSKTSKGGHTKQDVKLKNTTVETKSSKSGHTYQYIVKPEPTAAVEKKTVRDPPVVNSYHVTLMKNPIYSKFEIIPAKKRKDVTILIIVSSAPKRYDRREAIRETYWKLCTPTNKVKPECIFMTDYQQPDSKFYNITRYESLKYGDMRFQKLEGGISFGIRFLYHMVWATLNYNFDYFLRVDDDYFFCLDRFLYELPTPMVLNFHWGWVHCSDNITRPEESMILFSNDLIRIFLDQNPTTMQCHPWADQMIGVWSNAFGMREIFRHDSRLHHHPIVSDVPELRLETNICQNYMGIHGCYPNDMKLFWKKRGPLYNKSSTNLIEQSRICKSKFDFDWSAFQYIWKYEPKLCINDPTWDTSKQTVRGGSYTGRQGRK